MNNFYKFIIAITTSVLVLLGAKLILNNSSKVEGDNNTIYFYNWGDYIDPEILESFEEETGYKVVYETFDSNEAMITKIEQNATAYDIAVPSEYTVEIMKNKNLLEKIDYEKIDGLENIDERFLDQDFDPKNKFSIPYFWGTFGIAYDSTKFSKEDFSSWAKLWDKKFKNEILIYDGARETLGIGLLKHNKSLNTTDKDTLNMVHDDLTLFMKNVKAILADEIKMYLSQSEASIGITFNGDASLAMEENENIEYIIPSEGSNIWFDNLVIPKTSENKEGAYALINYLLRPDVAAKNAEYIMYSSPNKEAIKLLDKEILDDKTLYPDDEIINKLEVFENLGQENIILYNDLFLDLKISPKAD